MSHTEQPLSFRTADLFVLLRNVKFLSEKQILRFAPLRMTFWIASPDSWAAWQLEILPNATRLQCFEVAAWARSTQGGGTSLRYSGDRGPHVALGWCFQIPRVVGDASRNLTIERSLYIVRSFYEEPRAISSLSTGTSCPNPCGDFGRRRRPCFRRRA